MALLRGANRPLLTKLIMQEVENEMKRGLREKIEIDFTSERVIQCAGDLAQLEYDDVVRSIGCGNTDRLTCFFNENENTAATNTKGALKPAETAANEESVAQETGNNRHFLTVNFY